MGAFDWFTDGVSALVNGGGRHPGTGRGGTSRRRPPTVAENITGNATRPRRPQRRQEGAGGARGNIDWNAIVGSPAYQEAVAGVQPPPPDGGGGGYGGGGGGGGGAPAYPLAENLEMLKRLVAGSRWNIATSGNAAKAELARLAADSASQGKQINAGITASGQNAKRESKAELARLMADMQRQGVQTQALGAEAGFQHRALDQNVQGQSALQQRLAQIQGEDVNNRAATSAAMTQGAMGQLDNAAAMAEYQIQMAAKEAAMQAAMAARSGGGGGGGGRSGGGGGGGFGDLTYPQALDVLERNSGQQYQEAFDDAGLWNADDEGLSFVSALNRDLQAGVIDVDEAYRRWNLKKRDPNFRLGTMRRRVNRYLDTVRGYERVNRGDAELRG